MQTWHYSKAFATKLLAEWAVFSAKKVIKLFKTEKLNGFYPVFCYSGMSGISHATALSLAVAAQNPEFEFGMAYVRKDKEESHGRPVEYNFPETSKKGYLVFVDDFISSGETMVRVFSNVLNILTGNVHLSNQGVEWKWYDEKGKVLVVDLRQFQHPDNQYYRSTAKDFDHATRMESLREIYP